MYSACNVSVERRALGLTNLENKVSHAESLCRGSLEGDEDRGPERVRKWGIMSRLCFSANDEHSPIAERR